MLLPLVPATARVNFKGTHQSKPFMCSLHVYVASVTMSQINMNSIASTCSQAWNTNISPRLFTSTILTSVEVIDLATREGFFGLDSTAHAGTIGTGTAMPVQVAICVTEKVQMRWRGGHPRFYLPAGPMADTSNGYLLTTTALGQWRSAVEAFRIAMTGTIGGSPWGGPVAVRYFHDGGVMYDPGKVLVVSAFQVHQRLDTQRRRLGKEVA